MRLLLDENLDWRLRRDLLDHQVESVPLIGWAGIENSELLRKAVEAGFDVPVTMDSNMVDNRTLGSMQSRSSRYERSRIDWLTLVR
jgi:predicted nuclease of predicted toxin-antitoxin system